MFWYFACFFAGLVLGASPFLLIALIWRVE
jgi:hypothetical protein